MPFHFGNRLYLVTIAALLILFPPGFAQNTSCSSPPAADSESSTTPPDSPASSDSDNSLGAAARRVKAQKLPRAKKVVTEENLDPMIGPLPSLKMDGAENGEEVIAAIAAYKQHHKPGEVEDAVRRWYDFYDEELEAAIKENIDIRVLREANINNGYDLCQEGHDYRKCQTRRMVEINGARHEQGEINRNNNLITRLQHSFMNVRNGLAQNGLNYKWFKIRTTNNIDRF